MKRLSKTLWYVILTAAILTGSTILISYGWLDNGVSVISVAGRLVGIGTTARTGNTAPQQQLAVWGGNVDVADPATLGTESLTNGALTSGTSWTVTGDFALAANAATYTDSTHAGTLNQSSGALAVAGVANRWYKFVYDISAVSPGMTQCSITTAFANNAFGTGFDITAGTGKIFYFRSAAAPGNFVISCTSTAGGALTLDNLSLTEVQGGNVIVNGLVTGGGASGIKIKSGTVGIGTTTFSPGASLTLFSGAAVSASGQPVLSIRALQSPTVGSGGRIQFRENSDTLIGEIGTYFDNGTMYGLTFSTYNNGFQESMHLLGNGTLGLGLSVPVYELDVSKGVGLTGTARFFDQTATTGTTLVTITPGAAQTTSSTVLDIQALARFGGLNSTAAVAGLIGATCPAVTCTAAFTWVKAIAADNSVVYFPVWK